MSKDTSAEELFDLCKQVYKVTAWGIEEGALKNHKLWYPEYAIPIYNSDYLLEKFRETENIDVVVGINRINDVQCYAKALNLMKIHRDIKTFADTPLKSLLKLTLALKQAGEL